MAIRRKNFMTKEHGFSLIEVLVASAILGILSLAMTSMFSRMNTEMTRVRLQQDVLSLRAELLEFFRNQENCSRQFQNLQFDSTNPTSQIFPYQNAVIAGPLGAPEFLLQSGKPIHSNGMTYTIEAVTAEDFVGAGAESFRAELKISFKTIPNYITPRPIVLPIFFNTDVMSPATNKKIISCGLEGSLYSRCQARTRTSSTNGVQTVCCDPNELLMSFASPLDEDNSAFSWTSKNCGTTSHVGAGNPIQILCCP